MVVGPDYRYFLEATKSILVVWREDTAAVQAMVDAAGLPLIVKNGHRYLGGYIGEKTEEHAWVGEKVEEWCEAVDKIGEAGKLVPQAAYAGMQRSLQQEWAFLLRVIPGIGHKFRELEERLRLGFFHPLLGGPITRTHRI